MRIVHIAGAGATTDGLRGWLDALDEGFGRAGHERIVVAPGDDDEIDGPRLQLRGRRVPRMPGRVRTDVERVRSIVRSLRPDRVEVSDRFVLASLGRLPVPTVLLGHAAPAGLPRRLVTDALNRRVAANVDAVVCPSTFAAVDWRRIGVEPIVVPVGVDLDTFAPTAQPQQRRHDVELVYAGRVGADRRPLVAVHVVQRLRSSGIDAGLTIAGTGPLLDDVRFRACRLGLPVRVLGHVPERARLASFLAAADIAILPGPHDTFGTAALEAMACGTPAAVTGAGAPAELVRGGPLGCGAVDDDVIAAVQLCRRSSTRDAARRAASRYPWARTVSAMLRVHDIERSEAAVAA